MCLQSYPLLEGNTVEMAAIPGGPKLPRTPQGPVSAGAKSGARTPAPSPEEAAAEESPVQQSPKVSFAPGSQVSKSSTRGLACGVKEATRLLEQEI